MLTTNKLSKVSWFSRNLGRRVLALRAWRGVLFNVDLNTCLCY